MQVDWILCRCYFPFYSAVLNNIHARLGILGRKSDKMYPRCLLNYYFSINVTTDNLWINNVTSLQVSPFKRLFAPQTRQHFCMTDRLDSHGYERDIGVPFMPFLFKSSSEPVMRDYRTATLSAVIKCSTIK